MYDEDEEDEDDEYGEYGSSRSSDRLPKGMVTHGKLTLKKRRTSEDNGQERLNIDSPFDDPLDALTPTDFPVESDEYNPFRYTYEMFIYELGMTIWVSFQIEGELDQEAARQPISFTAKGVQYSFPFFPKTTTGTDPGDNWDGVIGRQYLDGEQQLWMFPTVHKAMVHTPGKDPANLSIEQVREFVTPEYLSGAIRNWAGRVRNDPQAPAALVCMLDDVEASFAPDPHAIRDGRESRPETIDEQITRVARPTPEEWQGLVAAVQAVKTELSLTRPIDIKQELEKRGWKLDMRLTPIRQAFGLPPMNSRQSPESGQGQS